MGTGVTGTFAIRWSQSSIDGTCGAADDVLEPGAHWRWSGRALRLDGPDGIARLGTADGAMELHRRAAGKARRMCGQIAMADRPGIEIDEDRLLDRGFLLTDGRRAFAASRIEGGAEDLVVFLGDLPPVDTDLWVARVSTTPRADARARLPVETGGTGVIAGTPIATPDGPRAAETLRPGDLVLTRDAGAQPLGWSGVRRLSGAALHMAPGLRPVRVAAGALGRGLPERDLLAAPGHRILISGRAVRALFAEAEVLVRARDLLDLPGVSMDLNATKATYVSLVLEPHQVIFAGGMPIETVSPDEIEAAPARRCLGAGEAAILVSGLV